MRPMLLLLLVSSTGLAQSAAGPAPCDEGAVRTELARLAEHAAAFRESRLDGAAARTLLRELKRLGETLRALERDYRRVAMRRCGVGSAEAVVMIGLLFESMASKLETLPPPAGLTADQQELYRTELLAQAAPLRERSAEAFDEAVREATALAVDSPLVREARARVSGRSFPQAH